MNHRASIVWLVLVAAAVPGPPGSGRAASAAPEGEPVTGIRLVFFPPVPPVYGAHIRDRPEQGPLRFRGRRLSPPDGLADFAGDTLYPALSTRLYSGQLSASLEARIEAYRARRNALVHALLDQCVTLHDATDEVRERELRVFAAVQTPAIAALELEADELRRELTRNRLGLDTGWNAGRPWRLNSFPAAREWLNLEAEFQVVRAAAYYDDGFVPVQRGLLRELAIELDGPARKARGEPADRRDIGAMFFSPETTRFHLPPDLPAEVQARIAAYNALKARLKVQLREAIHQLDKASRAERTAAFTRLADDQWPAIAELERLAEELRTDLAPRFVPMPPQKPPAIPAWLIDVIHRYNEDRDTYFGEMRSVMREAADAVPRVTRRDNSDERIREEDETAARRKEAVRRAVLDFQQRNAERFAALHARYTAIREALEAIARTTQDPRTGRPLNVDTLLQQHASAMAEFDGFGRATAIYTNYRTAMLQRGFSPEQRRLLFAYAIVALAQPLPDGEMLPRSATKYPIPR